MVLEAVGTVVTGIGAAFLLVGSLGVFRMPDVYNRLQAGTKCTTLGACLAIVGVGIMEPSWLPKTLLIAGFILLTNPISNHALGRASRKSGVELCRRSVVDMTDSLGEYGKEGE
ncbi:MAG: cation:proton antiporter [Candidatus Aegiribacteria sp. MLS_C]|nr:MAG: cation:proton antiporter [Candidatus Aegiribacteria sp. MLS_C]